MARFSDVTRQGRDKRVQWETREINMPAQTTPQEAKTMLTEYAEYGHWELARLRLYRDGRRWALLRRRQMRVPRPSWMDVGAELE